MKLPVTDTVISFVFKLWSGFKITAKNTPCGNHDYSNRDNMRFNIQKKL